jgi:hypothetical protein
MRFLKLFIWIIILYVFLPKQTVYVSSIQSPPEDGRRLRLEAFFKAKGSPLVPLAGVFIREADKNGLDWKLLPAVCCAESSCGKNYNKNAFGWGSDQIDYGTDEQDIAQIANRIRTLSYYQIYRKSGRLFDFAVAYNGHYAQDYFEKIAYFYEDL